MFDILKAKNKQNKQKKSGGKKYNDIGSCRRDILFFEMF
jgi:hypothetical protein